MIKIIAPEQFKKVPWKNGKGATIELAISLGGTIGGFDWRISMATVKEDGPFSDFTGYYRHLVLIEGAGLELNHGESVVDHLDNPLSVASFNGACKTFATLKSGPISDFNIMTKDTSYSTIVFTSIPQKNIQLLPCKICFIYSLIGTSKFIHRGTSSTYLLPAGHLMQIEALDMEKWIISGEKLIVAFLKKRTSN